MLLHRTGVLTLDWNAWNVKLSLLYQDATFWHLEELLGLLPDLQAGLVGAEIVLGGTGMQNKSSQLTTLTGD